LLLTALVLFCCTTNPADTRVPAPSAPAQINTSATGKTVEADSAKPDAPTPKSMATPNAKGDADSGLSTDASAPSIEPPVETPVKLATTDSYETARQREIWYGLVAVGHGAAAFDAWTTRRAVGSGYGIEADPLERPFAHSGAIYATTQVTPLIMDYVGRWMMRSSHNWVRKTWWVPQAASAGVSVGAGVHNYNVVP
jgi:hypothetical protein